MEGTPDEFEFFKELNFDQVDSLSNSFSFNEGEAEAENLLFSHLEYHFPFDDSNKNIPDHSQLLEKITKCEDNYSNLLKNNLIPPDRNPKLKIAENFGSNLNLAEKTLPGLLISIMYKEEGPCDENTLLSTVYPKFEDLRKLNGARYSDNVLKVLKSTLSSSGIFFKTVDNKYYFKEKEAFDYIIKVTETVLIKKAEKKSKSTSSKTSSKTTKSKKKRSTQSLSGQINYKICKVYNMLDQMLTQWRGRVELEKASSYLNNANSSIELLQKIGDKNKMVGILMGFKYFKSIINNYNKLCAKKKKNESIIDINKLSEKLDVLSQKMEYLEKNISCIKGVSESMYNQKSEGQPQSSEPELSEVPQSNFLFNTDNLSFQIDL